MNEKIKKVIKFTALYIAQVGALWGLLEGFSYFKGNALKEFLGQYWVLIYIIPIITTTACIIHRGGSDEAAVKENISTQGKFSPGKVGGNFAVRGQTGNSDQTNPAEINSEENGPDNSTEKTIKSIETKGDYSPGEVEGDYTVEG